MGIIDTIFERIRLIVMMSGSYAFDKDGNVIDGVNIRYSTVLTPLEETEYGREAKRLAKRRERYGQENEARRLRRAKQKAENPEAVKEKRRQEYLKYGEKAKENRRNKRREVYNGVV